MKLLAPFQFSMTFSPVLISRLSCAGYMGHPFRKLTVCTSPIFLFFHFPLVNDRENRGMENRSPVFRELGRKKPCEPGKHAACLPGSQNRDECREPKNTGQLWPHHVTLSNASTGDTLFSTYAARR